MSAGDKSITLVGGGGAGLNEFLKAMLKSV